ncbi:hypothetical protein IW261DRAFT_1426144 [Armillaria novae-zelandiae]|uniref:Uncharacterized protein n=1 Tax=Armillaria novae-zelandiae TaxID=153914 RepID=A0AA39U1B6_9AGAR|nr:hypothetical protein IW261DRAFT_1426144 [Armillaria novae-zelandiae]
MPRRSALKAESIHGCAGSFCAFSTPPFFGHFSPGRATHSVAIAKDLTSRPSKQFTVEKGGDTVLGGGNRDCMSFPSKRHDSSDSKPHEFIRNGYTSRQDEIKLCGLQWRCAAEGDVPFHHSILGKLAKTEVSPESSPITATSFRHVDHVPTRPDPSLAPLQKHEVFQRRYIHQFSDHHDCHLEEEEYIRDCHGTTGGFAALVGAFQFAFVGQDGPEEVDREPNLPGAVERNEEAGDENEIGCGCATPFLWSSTTTTHSTVIPDALAMYGARAQSLGLLVNHRPAVRQLIARHFASRTRCKRIGVASSTITVGPVPLGYMGKYRARYRSQDTLSKAPASINDQPDSETRRTVDIFAFRLMLDTFSSRRRPVTICQAIFQEHETQRWQIEQEDVTSDGSRCSLAVNDWKRRSIGSGGIIVCRMDRKYSTRVPWQNLYLSKKPKRHQGLDFMVEERHKRAAKRWAEEEIRYGAKGPSKSRRLKGEWTSYTTILDNGA